MPELPDVEGFRKYFNETALNKKIIKTELISPEMLRKGSPKDLVKYTEGEKFISSLRHGKYFFAGLSSNKYLMLHFGMTGYLIYYKLPEDAGGHIRLQFKLDDGFYLAYDNLRKFGAILLIDDPAEYIKEKELGPDPINDGLTYNKFRERVDSKSGNIKAVLMDQSVLAGIGNLYSDEILYQAGVHPSKLFSSIKEDGKKEVYKKMMSVLKAAVKKDGDHSALPGKYLLNHRSDGEKCPICGGKIVHKTIAGRTAYFCNSHQKK